MPLERAPAAPAGLRAALRPPRRVPCVQPRVQRPPRTHLLALPSEVLRLILTHMGPPAPRGTVPFAAWPLAMVCARLRDELYAAVTRVELRDCLAVPRAGPDASAAILARPLRKCNALMKLDLSGCDALHDRQIAAFCRQSVLKLQTFKATICKGQTDEAVKHVCRSSGTALLHIDLAGCDWYRHRIDGAHSPGNPCHALTDATLLTLVDFCPNLRSITLSKAACITDRGLFALATMSALESLTLGGSLEISDAGVKAMADGNNRLVRLELMSCDNVSDEALYAVAKGRATCRLEVVALADNSTITNSGVRALVHALPYLVDLHVVYCSRVTEKWCLGLPAGHAVSLRRLNLRGAHFDSASQGICDLARIASPDGINLSYINKVDAAALEQVRVSFPDLDILLLEGCRGVDETSAAVLAEFSALTALDISWCFNLTSSGIQKIVSGPVAPSLTRLCLGPIDGSHLEVLQDVVESCYNLEEFVLCGEICEDAIAWLRAHCLAKVDYGAVRILRSKRHDRRSRGSPARGSGRRRGHTFAITLPLGT